MRVLHIDSEMGWRGGENQLRLLVEGLNARGVENFLAARPNSEVVSRLRNSLAGVIQAPLQGSLDLVSARRIARYCQANAIDLIDTQTSIGHSIGLLSRYSYDRPKLVVHRRVDNPLGKGLMGRVKYLSPKVDRYVAISHAIHQILCGYGVPEDRIATVRSATDPRPFLGIDRHQAKVDLAKAFSLDPAFCFIGNASALSAQKGHETFIQAIYELRKRKLPVHGFLAGTGDQQNELEKLRMDLDLDHDVTFLGFVKEMPEFLSALDILAVPSRNEGLGTVILDGIHAGCCICASDVGGIPEIIRDQETGILCPAGDLDAWTHNLQALSADVGLRERLANAARAHIAQEFSLDAMVEGNLQVYNSLLST